MIIVPLMRTFAEIGTKLSAISALMCLIRRIKR